MRTIWFTTLSTVKKLWKRLKDKIDKRLHRKAGIVFAAVLLVMICISLVLSHGKTNDSIFFISQGGTTLIQDNKYNPATEGRFIEVTGPVIIKRSVTDPLTGLSMYAVALCRNAEMYQWDQKSKAIDSEYGAKILPYAAYSYIKKWSSKPICSASFADLDKHSNPTMLIKDHKYINNEVYIGDYKISPKILSSLPASKNIILEKSIEQNIKTDKHVTVLDGTLYIGNDIYSPTVGDYILSYKMSVPESLTVAGIQERKEIVPRKGRNIGKSFFVKEKYT